ncbi:MAG: beta-lactamase family protein [Saprospiraceae bacterium]|nr:beta-lactamase family protein [Saprospiraceae bacterium]
MRIPNQILLFTSLFILVLSPSCKKDPIVLNNKSIHFDVLAQNLEDAFGPGCVGFQYSISQNGTLKTENAIGKAILAIDGPETNYTVNHRKSVHSMTKTITAAAMVHALEANGISVDAFIAPYLPERWELSPEVDDITFRELLTHKSGLRGTRDSYESMKTYMEAGGFSTKDVSTSVGYANVNFTLMRILIPMTSPIVNPALNDVLNTQGGESFDNMVSQGYIAYVRNTVLIPAGVDEEVGPYLWDTDEAEATRNYNFSNQSLNGYIHTDQTLLTGAGGWYMNTHDYSAFLAYLFHSQLPGIDQDEMISGELGMYVGKYGSLDYYTHNGAINNALDQGGRAEWIQIPSSDVTMVVQINSAENAFSTSEITGMMLDAYLDSYY